MLKVEIIEIDRDYRAYVGSEFILFSSLKAAQDYCDKKTWTGSDYMVGLVLNA